MSSTALVLTVADTDLTLTLEVPPVLGIGIEETNLILLAAQDELAITNPPAPVYASPPVSPVQSFVVTGQTDLTCTHNLGRLAMAQFIHASGQSAGVSLTHTLNTIRLQSNVPVSGTLICS